jgi:hypothetical protein
MTRKLLIARLGAGTITVALCATLPGCNLAITQIPTGCFGDPSSRGMSSVECPADADATSDSARDATSDGTRDGTRDGADGPGGDAAGDRP